MRNSVVHDLLLSEISAVVSWLRKVAVRLERRRRMGVVYAKNIAPTCKDGDVPLRIVEKDREDPCSSHALQRDVITPRVNARTA